MKLFGELEAVKFPEEDLIFVTHSGYLYYIYNPKYKHWRKHRNAGSDYITVHKYQEVSKEELLEAMQGSFPGKETDFLRMCPPEQLNNWEMAALLTEDYGEYMSDSAILDGIYRFLEESGIRYKSFLGIRKILDSAAKLKKSHGQVFREVRELSLATVGRDIFKEEIGIVDGHDCSSYFWFMPVRVLDYANTDEIDNVAEMKSGEISIEQGDVSRYLMPFLHQHFDDELEANKRRMDSLCVDEDEIVAISGFAWYLTHNFYTFAAIEKMLQDISDTMEALSSGRETQYTAQIRPNINFKTPEPVIDFYRRFIYRMEYMIKVGKEKGYTLISIMGP